MQIVIAMKKLHLKNSTVMCLSRNSALVSNSQTLLWTVFIVTSELSTKEIQ